jgi:glycosyltransferase involved in cell wall biosynthesis
MHIAIDATSLPPRLLGAANYILSLTRALDDLSTEVHMTVIVQEPHRARFAGLRRLQVAHVPRMSPLARILWEQVRLPGLCRRLGTDLLHSPHYTMPLTHPCGSVVTFHDMTFFRTPEVHLGYKRLFFRSMIRLSARRADALVVPSESTARDLEGVCPQATAKTRLIPLGVSDMFRPADKVERAQAVCARYGLPDEYLLYVGNLEPRKNLPVLLRAYARLARERPAPVLVLAGPRGWKDAPLFATIRDLDLEGRLVFPGYIPQDDLPAVYSRATAFIYPSLYEGFGLPVLEAMACGTPVITSNVSSMPEVTGDAGVLVPPHDVEALAGAIERLLGDAELRQDLSRRGMARAREFTWRRAAEATLGVYCQVLGAP